MFRKFRSLALAFIFISGCTASVSKTTATKAVKRSTPGSSSSKITATPGKGVYIGISGTVTDISFSNQVITLDKTVNDFNKIALTEESELLDQYGNEISLQEIQPGMTIQVVGKAGKDAIIAQKVLLPRPTSLPSTLQFSDEHVNAIDTIRTKLDLPNLPLEFITRVPDPNSPTGSLAVSKYRDAEGRIFSVDPITNRVIEINARPIISSISSDVTTTSTEALEEKAKEMFASTVPDSSSQSQLRYEQANKSDAYFFNWYDESKVGFLNRPQLQIGLHQNGELVVYYNTLYLEN